jgi:ABC-2 type transport system permease protein
MRKVFVVAKREYNAAVKTKAFLVGLFIMPALMCGSVLVQYLLKDHVDIEEKRVAVVDRTPGQTVLHALEAAAETRKTTEILDPTSGRQIKPVFAVESVVASGGAPDEIERQRFELSERVRRGELFGFLEVGSKVTDLPNIASAPTPQSVVAGATTDSLVVRYQSNRPTYDQIHKWARTIIEAKVREARFQNSGLPADKVGVVLAPVPLLVKGLSERDSRTGTIHEGKDDNPAVSMMVPAALMILMFMLILAGGTPAMQGVVEEKMNRISEMVLGSIRPFELMMGKVLGLMAVSLTLAFIYLGAAYWAAWYYGVAGLITPGVMAWFFVYLILAVIMYGSLFIAVGTACSDLQQTQTMLWPVMLLAMLPLFVWLNVVREPTSTFSTVASLIPTATPMLMLLRIAVPPGIHWWQPVLGLVGMLLMTLACVYAAGRIFRVGILMQGKGASFRDLARWIVRG